MNLKKLFLIISSLIIIIGLFITLLSKDYTANNEYAKFFTDIESKIDSVKKIEIETTENAVYLFNNNGKWEIPGYENYPASGEKIKKFLISIVQLKGVDKKTKNPALHEKLGLAFPLKQESIRIRLLDNEKNLISDFIIGNTSSHNEQFSYIREFDSEQTWLFKNEFDFKTTDIDWTEDSILKIARWRIKSVKIEGSNKKSENIYIYKDKYSDQSFKLDNIPNGFVLNSNFNLSNFSSMLESVKKLDIKSSILNDKDNNLRQLYFETFDGLIIKIKSFKSGNDIYYHFDVDSDFEVRNELDDNEPNIVGLPKMMTFEEIEEEKAKYKYLKNWYFKLYKDFNTGTNFTLQDLIVKKNSN